LVELGLLTREDTRASQRARYSLTEPKPARLRSRVAFSYVPATVEGFVEDKHQQQGRADDNKPDDEKHDQQSPA